MLDSVCHRCKMICTHSVSLYCWFRTCSESRTGSNLGSSCLSFSVLDLQVCATVSRSQPFYTHWRFVIRPLVVFFLLSTSSSLFSEHHRLVFELLVRLWLLYLVLSWPTAGWIPLFAGVPFCLLLLCVTSLFLTDFIAAMSLLSTLGSIWTHCLGVEPMRPGTQGSSYKSLLLSLRPTLSLKLHLVKASDPFKAPSPAGDCVYTEESAIISSLHS